MHPVEAEDALSLQIYLFMCLQATPWSQAQPWFSWFSPIGGQTRLGWGWRGGCVSCLSHTVNKGLSQNSGPRAALAASPHQMSVPVTLTPSLPSQGTQKEKRNPLGSQSLRRCC